MCELLRANLYEFQRHQREHGDAPYFTPRRLQAVARQVLTSLAFLHGLGLIHSDLKPENILVKSYSRCALWLFGFWVCFCVLGAVWGLVAVCAHTFKRSTKTPNKTPNKTKPNTQTQTNSKRCEVKVIDLGSSCFASDRLSSYVQSRSYRAPEVILGLPYDARVDVWSLGAILAELATGAVLFQVGVVDCAFVFVCVCVRAASLPAVHVAHSIITNHNHPTHALNKTTKHKERLARDAARARRGHLGAAARLDGRRGAPQPPLLHARQRTAVRALARDRQVRFVSFCCVVCCCGVAVVLCSVSFVVDLRRARTRAPTLEHKKTNTNKTKKRRYELLRPKRTSLRHRVAGADESLLDFLAFLLTVDPRARPSAERALQHPGLQYPYPEADGDAVQD